MNLRAKSSMKLSMRTSMKVIIAVASLSIIAIFIGAIFFFNVADVRHVFGASKTTTQSGNWDDPATWGGASVPTTSDIVTVNHTITMRGNCFADKIIVNASGILQDDGVAHILTIDGTSGNDLSVTGTLNIPNATIKFNRNNQIDGAGTFNISKFDLNGNTVTLQSTCTGVINLVGVPDPFLNPGNLSPGTASTISYAGIVAQVVSSNSGIKFRNLVINNSAGVTLQKNITTSNLTGNLEVQSGTLCNGGFTITGNGSKTITIKNNAGIDASGNTTAFSGFGTKVIEANSTVNYSGTNQNVAIANYGNLIISGSGIKTMQGNGSVNQLTLTTGSLDLNASTLTINNSSPSAISRSGGGIISENTSIASKVQWNVGTAVGSYLFPFVTATGSYIPFTFLVTTAGVGSGNITLATYSTPTNNLPYPPGVTNINSGSTDNSPNTVDRFWQIDANSYTTKPVATITFTATSAEIGTITALKAQRWNGTSWDTPLPNQTVASNSVTVPNVSMFSPWVESGNGSPLPIKLTNFNAKHNNKTVEVSWITSTEVNNDYFTVERSLTGKTFTKIGTVKGAGNSNENKNYNLTDENPLYGTSYYRLKQTDFDGKTEYFPVIAVKSQTNKTVNTVMDLSINYIAPNPFQNHFTVSYSINNGGKVEIQLFSINGQLVLQEESSVNSGLNQYEFNDNVLLEAGIYILKIAANENVISKKIIKN